MLLSIIIPVYNVEKYLRKCLVSCYDQDIDLNEYEVIAVNDGSPDNSHIILEEYLGRYPNFKVINQKNQGLSTARNNGLEVAKGKYVWFVDSDDAITPDCLGGICKDLESGPDLLQIQFEYIFENGESIEAPKVYWNGTLSGKELTAEGGVPEPAQFTIYKRKFLQENNLRFTPGIYHEDCDFKYRCVWFAKVCRSHPKTVYSYLQRSEGSISKNFKLKNAEDYLFVVRGIIGFIKEYGINSEAKSALCERIGIYINMIFKGASQLPESDRTKILSLIKKNTEIWSFMRKSPKLNHKLEAISLFINLNIVGSFIIKLYGAKG